MGLTWFKCAGCFPLWSCGWLGAVAHCHCPASWEVIGWYIVSWGKIQIQNSMSGFYQMSIIFSCWKINNSNHWRSGSMWKVSALYLPTQMAYLSSFFQKKGSSEGTFNLSSLYERNYFEVAVLPSAPLSPHTDFFHSYYIFRILGHVLRDQCYLQEDRSQARGLRWNVSPLA